ncbi:tannase/feruloyl esterase family alpha/beta hydrolase [Pararobbsia silviterrae]|uniref:Tannase/feruloyl esterase family alpha/beta hydrolase n=1 Tax=Pararobbsia silviterrae TaxID=1792498 RepID=A0A494XS83_9BURK|nr:tannase/feruloyl esterase family alpha/beta hydrolase [Pararobbsia silviterrae]RKP53497.1 tannase/feruloyl esterase family alpha/beta hydrolase [Pararobbsia silviterrae]
MPSKLRLPSLVVAALLLPGCAALHPDTTARSGDGASNANNANGLACAQLVGLQIPSSAIGLPTSGAVVTTAAHVDPSGEGSKAVPAHCAVTASIAPHDPAAPAVKLKIALPDAWNAKAVMYGGGGLDGTMPNVVGNVPAGPADRPYPIARGYAVFGSDSGHQAGPLGSQDGAFASNDEALMNWNAGDALKKTRDVAVYVIRTRYGQAPARAYFIGGSTGGREALTAIQRWPGDWDGAIAWYPAWAGMVSILGGQRMSRALAAPGAYLTPAKRKTLFDAAMQACDALDGVRDGLISNQAECNRLFDPASATVDGHPLRCPDGHDTGDRCLSDAQIQAVKTINAPMRLTYLASGLTEHPGFNIWGADTGIGEGDDVLHKTVLWLALGHAAPTMPMPKNAPYVSVLADQWFKYAVTRDPNADTLAIDPERPGPWADRISDLSRTLDAKTDLSAFKARGGKLLLAHGLSDVLVSTRSTEDYYGRLVSQMGPEAVRSFARFYEVPGYNHAASAVFNASWDSLTALEHWVENGAAPADQIVTDTAGVPGRTRPLCEYPTWPRYNGSGSVDAAASFTCVR